MNILGNARRSVKNLTPFKIFLLITSPFTLSFLIHIIILGLSAYTTWYISSTNDVEDDLAATIVVDERTSDRFSFEDTNTLNQFKVDSTLAYSFPQVEYRPVVPDVAFYPEPTNLEDLDSERALRLPQQR